MRSIRRWPRVLLRRSSFLIVFLLFLGWAADRGDLTPRCLRAPHGERPVAITRVVDGDTLADDCDRRLRIVGVDTPERDTPWGPTATAFTRDWIAADPDGLTVLHCRAAPEDRYGRRLVRLRRRDGEDLATALLRAGQAWPLHMPPCGTPWQSTDLAAFREARDARRGLWHDWDGRPHSVSNALAVRGWLRVRGEIAAIGAPEGSVRSLRLAGGRGLRVDLSGAWAAALPLAVGDVVEVEGWIGSRNPARMRVRDREALRTTPVNSSRRSGTSGTGPPR